MDVQSPATKREVSSVKKSSSEIKKKALKVWEQICINSNEVDPESEYIWEGIFVGVVIALGGTADYARELYREEAGDMEGSL